MKVEDREWRTEEGAETGAWTMGSSFEGNLALAAFLGVVVEKVGLEGVLGQGVKGWCAKTTVKFTGSGNANF